MGCVGVFWGVGGTNRWGYTHQAGHVDLIYTYSKFGGKGKCSIALSTLAWNV